MTGTGISAVSRADSAASSAPGMSSCGHFTAMSRTSDAGMSGIARASSASGMSSCGYLTAMSRTANSGMSGIAQAVTARMRS